MPLKTNAFRTLTLFSTLGLSLTVSPNWADDTETLPAASAPTPSATTATVASPSTTDPNAEPEPNPADDKKIKPPHYIAVDLGEGYDIMPTVGQDLIGAWPGAVHSLGGGSNYYAGLLDHQSSGRLIDPRYYLGKDETGSPLMGGKFYGAPDADEYFREYRDKMDVALNNKDQVVAALDYVHEMKTDTYTPLLLTGTQSTRLNAYVKAIYDVRDGTGRSTFLKSGVRPDSLEAKFDPHTHWVVDDQVYGPTEAKIWMAKAYGINNAGHVVGVANYEFGSMACEYVGNKLHLLPTVPYGNSAAVAINDSGQILIDVASRTVAEEKRIISEFYLTNIYYHTLRYNNGAVTDLGDCEGHEVRGYAMNNAGQVAGVSYTRSFPAEAREGERRGHTISPILYHAALYTNGKWKDLGTLGGETSCALAINDQGQVTGWAQTKDGVKHAFLYANGKMKNLDKPGSSWSLGRAINKQGDIAVWSQTGTFLMSRGKRWNLQDLVHTKPGAKLRVPYCINDNGMIITEAYESGQPIPHLYALVPIKDKSDTAMDDPEKDDQPVTPSK